MPYANETYRKSYDRKRNKQRKPHLNLPRSQQTERRYLTAYEHARIKRLRQEGIPMTDIARYFGIAYGTVTGIVYGRKKTRMRE